MRASVLQWRGVQAQEEALSSGQPSAGYLIDLTMIAKACGYRTVGHAVETKEELQQIVRENQLGEMPLFIDVHVRQGIRSDMPKLNIEHKAMKEALMKNLIR